MKKKQSKFGAIETILILIIVVILAFIGWYVYHIRSTMNNSSPAQNQTTTNQPGSSDLYYDKNGCTQSKTGGIHPDLCVKQ